MRDVLKPGGIEYVTPEQQKYIEMGIQAAKDEQIDELNSHLKDIAKELHLINTSIKGI